VNDNTSPELTHHFRVTDGDGPPVILPLPSNRWDGQAKRTEENRTTVNLEAFGDLVESIHTALVDLNRSGNLDINSSLGGENVLVDRYRTQV
jgi:hypothetical protein